MSAQGLQSKTVASDASECRPVVVGGGPAPKTSNEGRGKRHHPHQAHAYRVSLQQGPGVPHSRPPEIQMKERHGAGHGTS